MLEEGVLGDMRSDTLRSTAKKIASAVIASAEDDAEDDAEDGAEDGGEDEELKEEEEQEEEHDEDDANALTWRSRSTNSFSAPVTGPCDYRWLRLRTHRIHSTARDCL